MSGNQQFSDNASALIAANLTTSGTTVQVAAGYGAQFPALSGTQYFMVCVEDTGGNIEIMKCTAISGDNLTVTRAQENTSALAFTANLARVELRETAGTFANFLQKSGDTMAGDLNMGSHNITNGVLGSGSSVESANEIVNTPIRGVTGVSTNQIVVPTDGTRATAGGAKIVCVGDTIAAFTIGQIIMWYGALGGIPTGWAPCDGGTYNGFVTPDFRNSAVPIGAGGATALGAQTLSETTTAISAGTPIIHAVTLSVGNLPSHGHGNTMWFGNGAQVVGAQGISSPGTYVTGGAGTGTAINWTSTAVGSGTAFTPTSDALPTHNHSIGIAAVGVYFICYVGP